MSLFDFNQPGMEESMGVVRQQIQTTEQLIAGLRAIVQAVDDGGWIGQGADAFRQEMEDLINDTLQMQDDLEYFNGALGQVLDQVLTLMQSINAVIRTV